METAGETAPDGPTELVLAPLLRPPMAGAAAAIVAVVAVVVLTAVALLIGSACGVSLASGTLQPEARCSSRSPDRIEVGGRGKGTSSSSAAVTRSSR